MTFHPRLLRRGDLLQLFSKSALLDCRKLYSSNQNTRPAVYGIRGWLLLFCVILTIVIPLFFLANVISVYYSANSLTNRLQGMFTITVIQNILALGMTIFSIYAGISLWQIRLNAVRIAKRYLICCMLYSIVVTFLPQMVELPSGAHRIMNLELIKGILRTFVFVAIWYTYLNRSKRVKVTFGTP